MEKGGTKHRNGRILIQLNTGSLLPTKDYRTGIIDTVGRTWNEASEWTVLSSLHNKSAHTASKLVREYFCSRSNINGGLMFTIDECLDCVGGASSVIHPGSSVNKSQSSYVNIT